MICCYSCDNERLKRIWILNVLSRLSLKFVTILRVSTKRGLKVIDEFIWNDVLLIAFENDLMKWVHLNPYSFRFRIEILPWNLQFSYEYSDLRCYTVSFEITTIFIKSNSHDSIWFHFCSRCRPYSGINAEWIFYRFFIVKVVASSARYCNKDFYRYHFTSKNLINLDSAQNIPFHSSCIPYICTQYFLSFSRIPKQIYSPQTCISTMNASYATQAIYLINLENPFTNNLATIIILVDNLCI